MDGWMGRGQHVYTALGLAVLKLCGLSEVQEVGGRRRIASAWGAAAWSQYRPFTWAYCDIIEGGKARTARRQGHKVYIIIFMPTLITEVERVCKWMGG